MSASDNIRISDKQNVHLGSPRKPKKVTIFTVHLAGERAHYHQGRFVAPGWDASDAECVRAYLLDARR